MRTQDFKNSFGTAKPYTRHLKNCIHQDQSNQNTCRCPKWLYERRKGEKAQRRSLTTPSWADAQRIASETLRGFDPDIAAARATVVVSERAKTTVHDACALWIARTEREYGNANTLAQYRCLTNKFERWARANAIGCIQDITTLQLERWYSSTEWTRRSEVYRANRWGVLRSLFNFLKERKVIVDNPIAPIKRVRVSGDLTQGPYSDDQVKRLFAHVAVAPIATTLPREEKLVYRQRMLAFLTLLLHTGCDLIDAVNFEPERIKDMKVDGVTFPVYRYNRTKTGVLAVIPLSDEVAAILRNVPPVPKSAEGMPFCIEGIHQRSGAGNWSHRICLLLKEAGIHEVSLPGKDKKGRARTKNANVKQFRHTFSVRSLVAGHRPEQVAKMLGHVDTTMIRKHYAPWVEELDTAHVRMIVETRAGNSAKPNRRLAVVPVPDRRRAVR
jgi:integrase